MVTVSVSTRVGKKCCTEKKTTKKQKVKSQNNVSTGERHTQNRMALHQKKRLRYKAYSDRRWKQHTELEYSPTSNERKKHTEQNSRSTVLAPEPIGQPGADKHTAW